MSQLLTSLVWRATEFLLAFGPLNPQTALDYFVLSPFFDRTSNNAVLRMQMQFSRGGMEGVDEQAELKRFVGSQYAVVHAASPGLFIIHKRDRTSPTEAETTAVYYILNDNVYQGPSIYSVINERILTSLHALSTTISLLQTHKPSWTPERLYEWDIKDAPASAIVPTAAAGEAERPAKRARGEEGVERDEAREARGDRLDEDEDATRPAETFNPLLFRALQTVAAGLEPPKQQQPGGGAGGTGTGTGTGGAVGTPAPAGGDAADGAKENGATKRKVSKTAA